MKLFHVILKLIQSLNLTDSENLAILSNDTKAWEMDATEDNPDKLKSLYAKIHKGVFFRLLTPFIYVFLMGWVKQVLNGRAEDEDDDIF